MDRSGQDIQAGDTARFYEEKWRRFILDAIGHYVYYEVPISVLQKILLDNPNEDKQIKNAMSAFFGWLVSQKLLKENPCSGLLIKPETPKDRGRCLEPT